MWDLFYGDFPDADTAGSAALRHLQPAAESVPVVPAGIAEFDYQTASKEV